MVDAGLSWGTLGPESLGGRRRVRTLGLGAAIRAYNQAAVPGTGGLWYCKQLVLAALGIRLAAEKRTRNIRMANTIEALACLLGTSENGHPDGRLRGRRKLAGCSPDASYKTVSSPSFYVTQPMRMGMAQPLISLGFAFGEGGSSRFNALQLTEIGHAFLDKALSNYSPNNTTVGKHLLMWVSGKTVKNNTSALRRALSPLVPLRPPETGILVEQLNKGEGAERRRAAMAWVRNHRRSNDWTARPIEIDEIHWNDLDAGARFFALRTVALDCLDAVEGQMAKRELYTLGFRDAVGYESVATLLNDVKEKADRVLALNQVPPGAHEATEFAETLTRGNPTQAMQFLVERDGRVLLSGASGIRRGSAFEFAARGDQPEPQEDDPDTDATATIELPIGISGRLRNLALLCMDIDGKLDAWIHGGTINTDLVPH
jgi:hypothetical protein